LLLRLRVPAPSAGEIADFAVTYASIPVREIPGAGDVPGVDTATPLGLLAAELARPLIVRALRHAARAERYASWAERRRELALDELRCTRDRLPDLAVTPLTSWMPFLGTA
jgi:hypothetical protein